MKKKIKFKEYYKKLKELWEIPKYRALIKLSLYGIMFIFIIVLANVYQETNKMDETEQTKSYTEIINALDLTNCDIKYKINTSINNYTLEGKIENNILSGYLDNNTEIKKIIIKENTIYEIKNNEELVNEEINNIINAKLIIPKNIIDIVKNSSAYINKGSEETTYTFEITDNNIKYEVVITIIEEKITNIEVSNEEIEYNMLVNFDK